MRRRAAVLACACCWLGLSLLAPREVAAASPPATGGALEISIGGFANIDLVGGDLPELYEDPDLSSAPDLANDVELHLLVRGSDEARGLDYGAVIEFEADTNADTNSEETWLFLRGGWGELRFGDTDGPVDDSGLGGFTVAAGTGGIDGQVVDALAVDAVLPTTSEAATKLSYATPVLAGWQLAASYTPADDASGDSLATARTERKDWIEAALIHEREFDTAELAASLVGGLGRITREDGGDGRLWSGHAGFALVLDSLELGAGIGAEDLDGEAKRYASLGVGTPLGPVYASLTASRVLDTDGYQGVGRPWNIVLSADLGLAEGLVLAGDLAYFDNDLDRTAQQEGLEGDRGWAWVIELGVSF